MVKKCVLPALALALLVAGCGTNKAGGGQNYGTKSIGPQQIREQTLHSNEQGPPKRNVRTNRDHLMGRNSNPNLIIGHQNVRNYGVDERNLLMMAKSVPGVEDARIRIEGGNVYVTLDLVHNVTASQARDVERRVIHAMRQKAPRYDYHLTSNDSGHR